MRRSQNTARWPEKLLAVADTDRNATRKALRVQARKVIARFGVDFCCRSNLCG